MSRLKLAIIGVGLIGGSLGLCLKDKLGEDIYITGLCRHQASMDRAVALGAVDYASADIEAVVSEADIVFLSPPVLQIVPMVEKILPYLKKGCILTDAGSTKGYIWQHLQKILPDDIYYIAGHPMTGREKSGVDAAMKDLFVGKAYVIVEDTGAPPEAHKKLMSVLKYTGANFTTSPSTIAVLRSLAMCRMSRLLRSSLCSTALATTATPASSSSAAASATRRASLRRMPTCGPISA